MSHSEEHPLAPPEKPLHPFWRCRFLARCWCGRETEMWVWQVLHPRGWSSQITWQEFAAKLRCTGCQRRGPEIRIPGYQGASSLPMGGGYPPPN